MKKILALTAAAFIAAVTPAFAGQLVSERPLLEKLKEKGILTDDDIKAVEKDTSSALELGGRLQVQYRSEGGDTGPAASDKHAATKTGFLVRRLTVEVKANLSSLGYAQIEPEFAGTTGWNKLNDAFIALIPASNLNVYVGQKKVPFSWEELTSTKNLAFVDSGYASQIGIGRQLGAEVEYFGADRFFAVNAGVYNGNLDTGAFGYLQQKKQRIYSNSNVSGNDNGGGNLLAARLELHPFGYLKKGYENLDHETKAAIGVSYYTSSDKGVTLVTPAAATASAASQGLWAKGSNAAGIDAIFRTGSLEVSGEYASRKLEYKYASDATAGNTVTEAAATEDSVNQSALQVAASYLVTDSVALAARYDVFSYGDENKFSNGGTAKAKEDKAVTLGASWYLKKHALKIQADYIQKDEAYSSAVLGTKEKAKNDVFVVQVAYAF